MAKRILGPLDPVSQLAEHELADVEALHRLAPGRRLTEKEGGPAMDRRWIGRGLCAAVLAVLVAGPGIVHAQVARPGQPSAGVRPQGPMGPPSPQATAPPAFRGWDHEWGDRDRGRDGDRHWASPGWRPDGWEGRPGGYGPYRPRYDPAYPYYVTPAPVWVPGQWAWTGWQWVWQPGYWRYD